MANVEVVSASELALLNELEKEFESGGVTARRISELPSRGIPPEIQSLVIPGVTSAGTLTVIYKIIAKVLDRHDKHEIQIVVGKRKFVIKGHSPEEEQQFVEALADLLK